MHLERNLNRPLRMLYLLIGVLLLAYALYLHEAIAGITLLLLIVVGVLLIMAGTTGH